MNYNTDIEELTAEVARLKEENEKTEQILIQNTKAVNEAKSRLKELTAERDAALREVERLREALEEVLSAHGIGREEGKP